MSLWFAPIPIVRIDSLKFWTFLFVHSSCRIVHILLLKGRMEDVDSVPHRSVKTSNQRSQQVEENWLCRSLQELDPGVMWPDSLDWQDLSSRCFHAKSWATKTASFGMSRPSLGINLKVAWRWVEEWLYRRQECEGGWVDVFRPFLWIAERFMLILG